MTKFEKYKKRVEAEDGNLVPEYSLVHMMETCTNFVNEMSQLEFVCQSLGVRALNTTKDHRVLLGLQQGIVS